MSTKLILMTMAMSLIVTGCKSTPSAKDEAGNPSWSGRMQQIGESFSTLLPLAMDPIQFNNPTNQSMIDSELHNLANFAHDVSHLQIKPSDDPSLATVSRQFSSDMVEAARQMRVGNRTYARFLIRNASNYCIACHTQTDRGPQFFATPGGPYFSKLGALEKANYLIAVRSYDAGLKEFEAAMNDPAIALQPFATLEAATLKALAVAVRIKKDPKMADAIVSRLLYSKWAPVYLQLSASTWKNSIHEWATSKKTFHTLDDAKFLMTKSWNKQVQSPLSRAGLIEALRASEVLHDLLAVKKPGRAYAEALYYAGLNAEALKDMDPFNLNQTYYEACIRHLPNSTIARNCYLRLEGAILTEYSALDSVPVPQSLREHMDELRKMAIPKDGFWMDWGKDHD